jgi:hypothetical protein
VWLSFERKAMQTYTTGRGRKKTVKKFTAREGLWMLGIILAALIGVLAMWLLGFVRFDMD